MAIQVGSNFSLKNKNFIDDRQSFDTIIEMVSFSENNIPEGFITYNKETNKYYNFNSINDVDITLGKWREYNGGGSTTDEKVKLSSSSTDAKYLEEFIDNSTIEIDNDKKCLVVKKIEGQTATVAEINFLTGLKSNIQEQINNLGKSMTMYGVFGSKADLLASISPVPVDGNTAIVIADETNSNKQMTYIYIEANSAWTPVAETTITVRDFTTDPINLSTETTGTLPKEKIDAAIARLADVLDIATYKGSGGGIVKKADTLTGLSYAISALNKAISDSHTHPNETVLNNIVSNGIGSRFLADNGKYIEILSIGTSTPTYESQIWIDTTNITPVLKIYDGTNWITVSGSGSSESGVNISQEDNNAIKSNTDGLFVEDKTEEIKEVDKKIGAIAKYHNYINTGLDYCYLKAETNNIELNNNQVIPFNIYNNGNMNYNIENYSILLKANKTYEISCDFLTDGTGYTYIDIYDLTHDKVVTSFGKTAANYNTNNSNSCGNCIYIPEEDCEIQIKMRNIVGTIRLYNRVDNAYFIAKEINRQVVINPVEYINNAQGIEDIPVGSIIDCSSVSNPPHYLICDGKEYNISDYPDLAQHFIDEFGQSNYYGGDGNTTFAVPFIGANYKSIIPVMLDYSQDGYVASASSEYSSAYPAWKVFTKTNNDQSDSWATANGETTGWVQIKIPYPIPVNKFSITARNENTGKTNLINFQLLGSNDGINFDTIISIEDEPIWGVNETRYYDIPNSSKAYVYYRLNVTKTSDTTYVDIGGFDLYQIYSTKAIKCERTCFMNINYVPVIADFGNINSSLGASNTQVRTLWEYVNNEDVSVRIKLSDLVAYTNTGSNEGYLNIEIEDTVTQSIYCSTSTYMNINIPEVTIPCGKSLVIKTNWDGHHSSVTWNLTGRFIAISDYSEMSSSTYTDDEISEAVDNILN